MFENLNRLLESAGGLSKDEISNQIKGLFSAIMERIDDNVKHISIEIYKDGDVALQLLNVDGEEVDKGGFLPKTFNGMDDIEKISSIIKESLLKTEVKKSGLKVTVKFSDSNDTETLFESANGGSPFRYLNRLLEAETGDEEEDEFSDEEFGDEDMEDDTEETDEEPTGDDDFENDDQEDDMSDDTEDESTTDEEENPDSEEDEDDPKKKINTTELSGLDGINLEIAKTNMLNKFINLKRMLKNNIEIYASLRQTLTDEKHIKLFDSVIEEFDGLLENIDVYIDYRLENNSYSKSLEVYIGNVSEAKILVQQIEQLAIELKKPVKKS